MLVQFLAVVRVGRSLLIEINFSWSISKISVPIEPAFAILFKLSDIILEPDIYCLPGKLSRVGEAKSAASKSTTVECIWDNVAVDFLVYV